MCDALGLHSGPLASLRGATPPNRNTLSHANKVRPAAMAEQLFWAVLERLGNVSPGFVSGRAGKRFARKFKRTIHLVDSTTIPLIASCLDWAKHRRRKAAAKCHLRLDLQSLRRSPFRSRSRSPCAIFRLSQSASRTDEAAELLPHFYKSAPLRPFQPEFSRKQKY